MSASEEGTASVGVLLYSSMRSAESHFLSEPVIRRAFFHVPLRLMAPIRDKFTIHSKAIVCQDVELKGDITIGSGTIVHPKATIFAVAGPIVIGSGCIIEESAIIVNRRVQTNCFHSITQRTMTGGRKLCVSATTISLK